MAPFATLVARGLGPLGSIESEIFGTSDPAEIARIVCAYCRRELGEDVVDGLFYRASVGCTAGVLLGSGRRVVVKAYQERWHGSFLRTVQGIQRQLAAAKFPCPVPVGDPAPLTPGRPSLVTAERFLADPGMRSLAGPVDRRTAAEGLARQIALSEGIEASGLADHPLATADEGALYPTPHSPWFDFEASADGAGWIDDCARRAKERRQHGASPSVVGHCDWSARNIRVVDSQLVAAYDWDSLSLVPESTAVGQAAATWSVTSEPGGSVFPGPAARAAFVREYEAARGRPFTESERRAVAGAAAWVLAYTARCEHAIETTGLARPDQRGARLRLQVEKEALFDLGPAGPVE
jgi:hypothetical protein